MLLAPMNSQPLSSDDLARDKQTLAREARASSRNDCALPSVAILGTRGLTSGYGGFEYFGQRLATYLGARGYPVSAYGIEHYRQPDAPPIAHVTQHWHRAPQHRALDKPLAAWRSVLHAACSRVDVLLMLGVSPALMAALPRVCSQRVIINLDGLEWQRPKWGPVGRAWLFASELVGRSVANETIVDSRALLRCHKSPILRMPHFIPYGTEVTEPGPHDQETLHAYGLNKGEYLLQACRLEPENNPQWVMDEYLRSDVELPLVLAGDNPYPSPYVRQLNTPAPGVRLVGRISETDYLCLLRNCRLYIHGHEIGGTNPSLLQAMGAGCPILALDTAFNQETLGECGQLWRKLPGSLATALNTRHQDTTWLNTQHRVARARAQTSYHWQPVLESYERIIMGQPPAYSEHPS